MARAVAAALLATAPLLAAAAAPAAADSVELPAVTSVLAADDACAKASTEKAEEETWSGPRSGSGGPGSCRRAPV
ncbi:hypothetical protein NKH77_28530 [Streptomyces sp. M19]